MPLICSECLSDITPATSWRSPESEFMRAQSQLPLTHLSNWFHCDLQWLLSYS